MRIIAGKFRGKKISAPTNIKARPTTDFAKEGLFNVLKNYRNLEGVNFLDVFSGTGNISYEFFSRGAATGDAVDISLASHKFRRKMIDELEIDMRSYKLDAFRFLRTCKKKYDIIFCDPPFTSSKINTIPTLIFKKELLNENGLLIVEHPSQIKFSKEINFVEQRSYGKVNFSIFRSSVNDEEE